jgi:hypothetical protein
MATNNIYYNPGTQPIVFAAAAAAWVHNTAYLTGILVTNGGNTYFCLVGHTSTNDAGTGFATDLAAGKWLLCTAVVWSPHIGHDASNGLAVTKTRISAVWDRGSGHLPADYEWFASARWVATPAAGNALRLYTIGAYGAGNNPALTEGYQTFGDATLAATSDILSASGCQSLGQVIAASAADQVWVNKGTVELYHRYIGIGGYNASATKSILFTLASGGAASNWVIFNPIPSVIEAAA